MESSDPSVSHDPPAAFDTPAASPDFLAAPALLAEPAVVEAPVQTAQKSPAIRAAGVGVWAKLAIGVSLVLAVACAIVFAMRQTRYCELAIETLPPGATVFLNGRLVGKTPVRVPDLPGGPYSLRLEKEDFAPLSLSINLGWGTTRLNETLPARGIGALKVTVDPVGAEVLLDGELVGHTPLDLNSVPSGSHELLIRKTNFKAFTQRISIDPGKAQEFRDFALEDLILTMLQNAIDKEPQRVANYTDMGHYLFANNKIKESAQFYVRGIHVYAKPLTFDAAVTPEERSLEQQLRAHDIERHNDEIRKKSAHMGRNLPQKEMKEFVRLIAEAQSAVATQNTGDWRFVYEQARNFVEEKKFDEAEQMYQRHIESAKGMETVAQAYIGLITLHIHSTKNIPKALAASKEFAASIYGNNPALARQAANAIYGSAATFADPERADLLAQAEALLRRALANSAKRTEMSALCKFELGNVLFLQGRFEECAPMYRDSVIETQEPTTKELRSQRQVDALRKLNQFDEAREVLKLLAKSPRPDIAAKAASDLRELAAMPSKQK